ncbi:tetratricopeptide repeat protein [Desulfobacula sp.]|uniref:tetratricopeptide repeat protein n=1 Tax=Desulfobacula sp. TaxID=2593537 RepID=UPI0025BD76DC|nr:tetratricopeptide repeat protein [Desulfobacula sp.]MBC2704270.1 tetratricopeptide repeat protein [Desulfobacula sp.]
MYQKGITQLKLKNYTQAAAFLKKAEQVMPESISAWFARADLFRIYTNYGKTLYNLGVKDWKEQGLSITSFDILIRAKFYLEKAAIIEPQHYINAYWLTRTEQGLEKSYVWLHPGKKNPYNAGPYYQKALPLRPSGITIRYAYLKYLHYKGFKTKIPELVRDMMEIHPPSYWQLKKESFYSDDLIPHIGQGLNFALEKQILPKDALKAFSDIYAAKNNFEKAISYYQDLLNLKPSLNSSGNYIHMGGLYLKAGQYQDGFNFFQKGFLISKSSHSAITRIYKLFKQEKLFMEFLRFSTYLQENNPGNPNFNISLDMSVAKCWLDMGYPQLAKARLIKINAARPHAPAYYHLAQIAAKEKNWDHMETAIQKATRLDQDNHSYYTLFSRALVNQKKYLHAEEVATKAIQHAPKNNPWVFNNRARIRWRLKKYALAAEDWKKAFAIKPDRSDFPYRIALAHEQQGQFKKALTFIKKAIALDPDNQAYKNLQKRLDQISRGLTPKIK